eukprot:TRINITY_DN325_c0_g7_i2.p2 TRINITY_DN325_c0_g7~~TRINITY_DN325_c0_g7_i2.p2  ORF type:complete len:339 (+),score=82.49 TRINITY_DN325_c0_g7_i2:54-1019(+)
MKVLLTGGAGFIGSHTAEALLNRGDEVVVVDEVNSYYDVSIKEENLAILRAYGEEKCRVHIFDICEKEKMREVFKAEKPDMICHLAARAGVRPSIEDPHIYVHSNVEGTLVMLEMAREFGTKNFVYASSSSVYGAAKKVPFCESDNDVDNPVSPYAATKRACELLSYTYHSLYKFPCAGLRFFTVYGPRGRPDMAPFIFVKNISSGKTIKQFGDGSSSRDYTFVGDIVQGVLGSLDNPQPYEVYNLGRGDTTTLKEFIDIVQELVGKKAIIDVLPMQPGDVPRTFADVSKARKLLKYDPTIPFRDGMKIFVEWYVSKYGKE